VNVATSHTHLVGGARRLDGGRVRSVAGRLVGDRRRSILWWTLGLLGLALFVIAFYPSIEGDDSFDEVMESLPESFQTLSGVSEGISISSPAGYLNSQYFSNMFPILLLVFGIGAGAAAIAGSESDGTLEQLLTEPVTRREVAVGRWLGVAGLVVLLTALGGVAVLAPAPLVGLLDGLSVVDLLAATAGVGVLAVLHMSIAFGVGAATGRKGVALGAASAVAFGGYLLYGLAESAEALNGLRLASPWYWFLGAEPLAEGFTVMLLVPGLLLALLVPIVGLWRFERRDLS